MSLRRVAWLALLLSTVACCRLTPAQAASSIEEQLIPVQGSATTQDAHLTHKYVVPFSIPAGMMMTGLRGTVTVKSSTDAFSESLLMVSVTNSPICANRTEEFVDYNTVFRKYSGQGLATIIVKQETTGTLTKKIDLRYPIGVKLPTRCGFITLDGSDFHNRPYRMDVNLKMSVAPVSEPTGHLTYGAHDEFVLGANNHDNAFSIMHIGADTTLLGVVGTIAATVVPGSALRVPNADWEVTHSVLVLHGGCTMFPNPKQDSSAPWLDPILRDKPVAYSTTMTGHGREALFKVVSATLPTPIALKRGDCLVHALHSGSKATTNGSGFNTEAQIYYETVGG